MKVLYNVTVNIDHEAHDDWVDWMQKHHIPDVMATGCFLESKMSRVLAQDMGGITYSIQYLAPDMASYHKYVHQLAPALQQEHTERYEGRFTAFRTILEVIHEEGQS